ncbi:MAG: MnhB domain-containing protein [Eubacteriales bacterium]|nr:MnhB domain-containing protein [Eubacteriales bacterium]
MNENLRIKRVIQRCGCDAVLPFALVYILYIILHGHLSPGGGFQGGVLMAGVVILLYLGHGFEATVDALSYHTLHKSEGVASVAYVALALMGVAAGAQFCQNILYTHGSIGDLYSSGTIFWMNVVVGVKVITGIGSISLLMISLLAGKDIDTTD